MRMSANIQLFVVAKLRTTVFGIYFSLLIGGGPGGTIPLYT